MKLEIGKKYVTREGSTVEILGQFDPDENEPVGYFIGKVIHFDGQTVELYELDGTHVTDGSGYQDITGEIDGR